MYQRPPDQAIIILPILIFPFESVQPVPKSIVILPEPFVLNAAVSYKIVAHLRRSSSVIVFATRAGGVSVLARALVAMSLVSPVWEETADSLLAVCVTSAEIGSAVLVHETTKAAIVNKNMATHILRDFSSVFIV